MKKTGSAGTIKVYDLGRASQNWSNTWKGGSGFENTKAQDVLWGVSLVGKHVKHGVRHNLGSGPNMRNAFSPRRM